MGRVHLAGRIVRLVLLSGLLSAALAGPAPAASVYWGANVGDHLTGSAVPYDMNAADAFASMVGRKMSLMHFVQAWGNCATTPCTMRPFPAKQMEAVRQAGAIPVFGWVSFSTPLTSGSYQPDYQLSDVIDGTYDVYIRQWARDAKAWGHPFFLSLDPEMNLVSTWPYVEARNGNKPGEFVDMWRHVHSIFTQEGVENATWSWCANNVFPGSAPLASVYPGDAYVDWTCMDGYNWNWGWQTPAQVFGQTYNAIQTLAPDKPILIGETASTEKNGDKAGWITDFFGTQLPKRFPNVKGVVWYEKKDPAVTQDPHGWLVESSQASIDAFRAAISAPYFADPAFKDLPAKTIQPLSPIVKGGGTATRPGTTGTGTVAGIRTVTATVTVGQAFSLPTASRCLRRGAPLTLRYRRPKAVTISEVQVLLGTRQIVRRSGRRARRSITLHRLPSRRFTLTIRATFADRRTASIRRSYRICSR